MMLSEIWPYLRDGAALIGGLVAVWTYYQARRQRHAEWLADLYTRFYEQPQYKRIRGILDYRSQPALDDLRRAIDTEIESDLSEQFVDYLNFFEFLGALRALGQLTDGEISSLFKYYLHNLAEHDFVVTFALKEGFEHLAGMLRQQRRPERT
jgi:hypothetical protein